MNGWLAEEMDGSGIYHAPKKQINKIGNRKYTLIQVENQLYSYHILTLLKLKLAFGNQHLWGIKPQ